MANRSEMARNAIRSDFQTSEIAAGHFVKKIFFKWPEMRSKVNFVYPKWPIDLKWPEIRSKVNFGHPKWSPAIWSKKKKKFRIDLKWPDIRSKVNCEQIKVTKIQIIVSI